MLQATVTTRVDMQKHEGLLVSVIVEYYMV